MATVSVRYRTSGAAFKATVASNTVVCIAGGGGAGGGGATGAGGGGGGAGSSVQVQTLTVGANQAFTVGNAGGGGASLAAGTAGTASTVNAQTSNPGGPGGGGSVGAGTAGTAGAAGTGGFAGAAGVAGGVGGGAGGSTGAASGQTGGAGAPAGGNGGAAAGAGVVPGGGGGGGGTLAAGGAGAKGMVAFIFTVGTSPTMSIGLNELNKVVHHPVTVGLTVTRSFARRVTAFRSSGIKTLTVSTDFVEKIIHHPVTRTLTVTVPRTTKRVGKVLTRTLTVTVPRTVKRITRAAVSKTLTVTVAFARALTARRTFATRVLTINALPTIGCLPLRRIPSGGGPVDFSPNDGLKSIAGIVRIAGSGPTAGAVVQLVRESDNFLAGTTTSAANGSYSFPRGSTDPNTYRVIVYKGSTVGGVSQSGVSPT